MTEPDGPPQPTIVVAVGGDPQLPFRLPPLGADVTVVAVDSGLDRLAEVGVVPHHLVGDLDSASPALVAAAEAGGAQVHRHPADKDATDLELALDLVTEELAGADDHVLVVGAGGGRLDLVVGDALLLAGPVLATTTVTAHLGPATVSVVRPWAARTVVGAPHEQVSLLPVHGSADGVTTTGLRWALVDAHLAAGTTRALSNELLGATATVAVGEGTLLAIQPGTVADPVAPRSTPYDPTPRGGDHP